MTDAQRSGQSFPAVESVIVTGASSGIGHATALHLAKAGFTVFAGVRKPSDGDSLKSAAPNVTPLEIDVTDSASISKPVRVVKGFVGQRGLDGLFNNAGVGMSQPIELASLGQLRNLFEVNLFGQIAAIQAFLPLIHRARGRIVNATASACLS